MNRLGHILVCFDFLQLVASQSWFGGSMLFVDEKAEAQSQAAGTAQNAVGSLLIVRKDGIQETLRGKGAVSLYDFDVLKTEPGNQA